MKSTFFCIDGHTCGNPVRVVAGGAPPLDGANMTERRAHFEREFDWIRTSLMFEPRGHEVMSGSILYPPTRPDCDIAILFIEVSGLFFLWLVRPAGARGRARPEYEDVVVL